MKSDEKTLLVLAILFGVISIVIEAAYLDIFVRVKYYTWGIFDDTNNVSLEIPELLAFGLGNLLIIGYSAYLLVKVNSRRSKKLSKQLKLLYIVGAIFVMVYGIMAVDLIDGDLGIGWDIYETGFGLISLFLEAVCYFVLIILSSK